MLIAEATAAQPASQIDMIMAAKTSIGLRSPHTLLRLLCLETRCPQLHSHVIWSHAGAQQAADLSASRWRPRRSSRATLSSGREAVGRSFSSLWGLTCCASLTCQRPG